MADPASCVVRSTWNLKERFSTHWSLIWTVEIGFGVPEGCCFSPWTVRLVADFSHPGSSDIQPWSRLIRGLIEMIFGWHVLNLLIFILNGGDWIWSLEQWWCVSENSDSILVRSLHCFMQVVLYLPRLIVLRYGWCKPLVSSRENCVTHWLY